MDAVIWLEDYLADWKKILFFVSHSQDFMNSVCTHIVRLDAKYKKLRYYRWRNGLLVLFLTNGACLSASLGMGIWAQSNLIIIFWIVTAMSASLF
jgi:hypothetical protein